MLIVKILLGLAGLGVVVFVHELGHFIAARLAGIDVEAFSIGWGRPLLKKKVGEVEYRLGMFPIGGYCKMKGETDFESFADGSSRDGNGKEEKEKGSYFGAHPLKRAFVCFMGPFFNLVFAVLVMSIIWGIGFEVNTEENRIVLLSDIEPGVSNPADEAGLKTGDRIVKIDGKTIANYLDIKENIAINPEENLPVTVERGGNLLELNVRPMLEKSSGAGIIGVYSWTDPVISSIAEYSPASAAGLLPGDRILKVNGGELPYTAALIPLLEGNPSSLSLEYEREGRVHNTKLEIAYTEDGFGETGILWKGRKFRSPALNPFAAVIKGVYETARIFAVSVKSLTLLFRGIDLTQAVSGPVRITYMVGDIAAEGFGRSFFMGISSMANFLALISIALCIMNLLPLPIIDGGMILLFLVEAVRGRPPHPRAIHIFQTIGVVVIFSLMLFAVFGDILFLARR